METQDETLTDASSSDAGSGGEETSDAGKTSKGDKGQTLGQLLQSTMDRNRALMNQGRFDKMDPKVVELLSDYHQMAIRPTDDDDSERSDSGASKNPTLEQIGRQALVDKEMNKVADKREQDVLVDVWSENARDLYAEFGNVQIEPDDFAKIDITDRRRFPLTRQAFVAWQKEAAAFRRKYYPLLVKASSASTEEEEGSSSDLAADREKAGATKRQPVVTTAGKATEDVVKASQQFRQGKLSREKLLETVRSKTDVI